jgi:hypothetical protein
MKYWHTNIKIAKGKEKRREKLQDLEGCGAIQLLIL